MKLERRIQHRSMFNGECRLWQAWDVSETPSDIEYHYWKDFDYSEANCRGKVNYVLSDDGIVVPVYAVAYVRQGIVLKTPFGQFILPKAHRSHARMLVLTESRGQTEDYGRYKHTPSAMTEAVVSQLAAHGLDLNEILDIMTVAQFSPKAQRISKFYKSEECKKMIRDEVRKILDNCGITEERVIEMLLEAHEVAKAKRDASNMLRATENLVDMYGLKDKVKESTTNTLEIGSEVEDLQRLESVKERLKLTQKKEAEQSA